MNATAHLKDLLPETAAATTRAELKQRLVVFARTLGFDSCRVAACSTPAHADEFDDWLDEGAHGQMEYMARATEKRREPQKILDGAKLFSGRLRAGVAINCRRAGSHYRRKSTRTHRPLRVGRRLSRLDRGEAG